MDADHRRNMGTIYYLIPDVFRESLSIRRLVGQARKGKLSSYLGSLVRGDNRPIGGVKIHYQHCALLREAGYVSRPLAMSKFHGEFFGFDLPVASISEVGFVLGPDDVVVSTEFCPYDGLRFRNCKRILFVQNWINVERRLRPEDRGRSYIDLGYDEVITCSNFTTNYVREKMGIEATTITNGIDLSVFYADPRERVGGRIMCLPRKNARDLAEIEKRVKEVAPDREFRRVDGASQGEIAQEFRRADIFLATGYPEGFGLPPLEAMASGAVVVGFTGGAASEFMKHRESALVAADGDCKAAAELLLEASRDSGLRTNLRTKGLEIAQQYSMQAMESALLSFYAQLGVGRAQLTNQRAL